MTLYDSRCVFHLYYEKTLITYQVTNDKGLSFLHKLNTSIDQTRLVNVQTTHNPIRTTLTQRQHVKALGRITTHDVRCGIQMNPVSSL